MSLVSFLEPSDRYREDPASAGPDELYYTARVTSSSTVTISNVSFRDQRPVPILDKPEDYRLAVARFRVPQEGIPIFNWSSFAAPLPPDQQDPTRVDRVTLVHVPSDTFITVALTYVGNAPDFPDGSPAGPVWTIGQYLLMVNNAFLAAFNAFTAPQRADLRAPPFFLYNNETQLFSLFIPVAYSSPSHFGDVYMTYTIARLFGNMGGNTPFSNQFPSATNSPLQFRYDGQSMHELNRQTVGLTDYYRMDQELPTLAVWSDVTFISFDSITIPLSPELQGPPAPEAKGQIGQEQFVYSFTDFAPLSTVPSREPIEFFPQGPLRWYSLGGGTPLYSITIGVSLVDRFGQRRPLPLIYGGVFDVKLVFRRKTLNLT